MGIIEAGTHTIIDVRTPEEYEQAHIPGARYVALSDLSVSDRSATGLVLELPPADQLRQQLAALKRESDRELVELIRRRLAMPVEKRTNFLRVRLPLPHGGTCL